MENFLEKSKSKLTKEKFLDKDLIEEDYGWLRELLKEEDYKKFIKQKLEESETDNENLEFANSSLEDADQTTKEFENLLNQKIIELKLAKIDTITDLKIRSYFFPKQYPKNFPNLWIER